MKIFHILLIGTVSVFSSVAQAAEQIAFGPPPAWVKPAVASFTDTKAKDAAVQVPLVDEQVFLEPGRKTAYTHYVLKIQTPQGLTAGHISFAWRPETDLVTVHKLHIRRGHQIIDVLAAGQTFTIARREANLENATLDGILTASLQPEGLQVGDTIEFAVSTTFADPVLKGHVEHMGGAWNEHPIGRAQLRMLWPSSLKARIRQTPDLPALKPITTGNLTSVELALDNVEPVIPPNGAPPRYHIARLVEVTDFGSWSDFGALMAPLYQKAAVIPPKGPLRDEAERIRAITDAEARAEAALALVQDRIRYVALVMGEGNLTPVDAEATWARRFGDCKAKTALLLALLHELGINAEPVAVSHTFGDGLDERLPMIGLFDHVLVKAIIEGRTYWMDGTRTGDTSLDRLRVPYFGWGVPLVPKAAEPIRMVPNPLEEPGEFVNIHMDAHAGLSLPAPTKVEVVLSGDTALALHTALTNMGTEVREQALRQYWRERFSSIDVASTQASFDQQAGALRLSMQGQARMDWSDGWYATLKTSVGYRADFHRTSGHGEDAPFAVPYPYYTKTIQTIQLPPGFTAEDTLRRKDVYEIVAGIEYYRRASFTDNVFVIEKTERSIAPEFPAREATAAQTALRELSNQGFSLRKPANYIPTPQELAAALASTPQTAAAFRQRGFMLMTYRRYEEAIADFSAALELQSDDAWALANRGLAYAWTGDNTAATRDLDAAYRLDPAVFVIYQAKGLIAERARAFDEAIAAYTRVLETQPQNSFALSRRAMAHYANDNPEAALQDAAAALQLAPADLPLYLLRASIYHQQGKPEDALAQAAAVVAAVPNSEHALVMAGQIYGSLQKQEEAQQAFERALALNPHPAAQAIVYTKRAAHLPNANDDERKADLDKALQLVPDFPEALLLSAGYLEKTDDFAGAASAYSKLIALTPPGNWIILLKRAAAHARSGNEAQARADYAAAREQVSDAKALNDICWSKATVGLDLETALADCDAAVAKAPDRPAMLDSRAFVLLRLGRLDDAIAAYDQALAKQPDLASSLFGRAVAWARKGDKERSDADAAAALKAQPDIRTQYARYGIEL